jgi:hypothetical protein
MNDGGHRALLLVFTSRMRLLTTFGHEGLPTPSMADEAALVEGEASFPLLGGQGRIRGGKEAQASEGREQIRFTNCSQRITTFSLS